MGAIKNELLSFVRSERELLSIANYLSSQEAINAGYSTDFLETNKNEILKQLEDIYNLNIDEINNLKPENVLKSEEVKYNSKDIITDVIIFLSVMCIIATLWFPLVNIYNIFFGRFNDVLYYKLRDIIMNIRKFYDKIPPIIGYNLVELLIFSLYYLLFRIPDNYLKSIFSFGTLIANMIRFHTSYIKYNRKGTNMNILWKLLGPLTITIYGCIKINGLIYHVIMDEILFISFHSVLSVLVKKFELFPSLLSIYLNEAILVLTTIAPHKFFEHIHNLNISRDNELFITNELRSLNILSTLITVGGFSIYIIEVLHFEIKRRKRICISLSSSISSLIFGIAFKSSYLILCSIDVFVLMLLIIIEQEILLSNRKKFKLCISILFSTLILLSFLKYYDRKYGIDRRMF